MTRDTTSSEGTSSLIHLGKLQSKVTALEGAKLKENAELKEAFAPVAEALKAFKDGVLGYGDKVVDREGGDSATGLERYKLTKRNLNKALTRAMSTDSVKDITILKDFRSVIKVFCTDFEGNKKKDTKGKDADEYLEKAAGFLGAIQEGFKPLEEGRDQTSVNRLKLFKELKDKCPKRKPFDISKPFDASETKIDEKIDESATEVAQDVGLGSKTMGAINVVGSGGVIALAVALPPLSLGIALAAILACILAGANIANDKYKESKSPLGNLLDQALKALPDSKEKGAFAQALDNVTQKSTRSTSANGLDNNNSEETESLLSARKDRNTSTSQSSDNLFPTRAPNDETVENLQNQLDDLRNDLVALRMTTSTQNRMAQSHENVWGALSGSEVSATETLSTTERATTSLGYYHQEGVATPTPTAATPTADISATAAATETLSMLEAINQAAKSGSGTVLGQAVAEGKGKGEGEGEGEGKGKGGRVRSPSSSWKATVSGKVETPGRANDGSGR